jgi:UDP-3-O-[3-hydroxymyristoyl] glucosamine N-acyltransferase
MLLGDLASQLDAELQGDPASSVRYLASLEQADEGALSFCSNQRHQHLLAATRATAVIVRPECAALTPRARMVMDDPYLGYAKASQLLHPIRQFTPGVHPGAFVHEDARIDPSAYVGPGAVVEAGCQVAAGCYIGPGCVIGRDCRIGRDCYLWANITLGPETQMGERNLIQPGAAIGGDGFGFANEQGRWVRIRQLGRVILGDDVEVGSNTTIDRGALDDTVIENGVKLDNLIQIGHNVRLGENTAIAACSGVSGSTKIGRNCTIGGAVGIAGHLHIADSTHFTGMSMVTRSVKEPGTYSSNMPAMPSREWRRLIGRLKRLDETEKRVKELERQLAALLQGNQANG